MATRLVVIEAPGKRKHVGSLLWQAGYRDAEVVATVGHIGTNPEGFKPLAIDAAYQETGYRLKPEKESLAAEIGRAASEASQIFLATDDDQEGDVIARDVLRFCIAGDDQAKVKRVRLKALSVAEVKAAFAAAAPFEELSAARGDARRIIDRLIGSLSSSAGAVGRVQGSLLLQLQEQAPVTGVATYTMPSQDQYGDWVARVPLHGGVVPGAHPGPLELTAGVGRSVMGVMAKHPKNFDDIVLSASLHTGADIQSVSKAMQGLYEKGQMSYPRARSTAITPEALRRVYALAKRNGAGFDPNLFRSVRAVQGEHSHEAPVPLGLDVPLNRSEVLMSLEDQVLVLLTRHLVECGMPCLVEQPRLMDLARLPPELAQLEWHRVVPQGERLWEPTSAEPGVQAWTAEQSLLHFMSQNGLGRPSTIIEHVNKFLSRGLVGQNFGLTPKGIEWCHNVGELFGYQNISKMIENYIDDNKKSPPHMVVDMIELCGLNAVGSAVQQQGFDHDEDIAISAHEFP